jgi:hypothetical protein
LPQVFRRGDGAGPDHPIQAMFSETAQAIVLLVRRPSGDTGCVRPRQPQPFSAAATNLLCEKRKKQRHRADCVMLTHETTGDRPGANAVDPWPTNEAFPS